MTRPVHRLPEWLSRSAQESPDATAVVAEDGAVDYGTLDEMAGRFARLLVESGCTTGDRVGHLMARSTDAIAALLGIYRAGAIAVPVDLACPAARIARVLRACECHAVLADADAITRIREIRALEDPPRLRLGWMDSAVGLLDPGLEVLFEAADAGSLPPLPQDPGGGPDAPAHVLFTSGSTGQPKGVVVTHASVIHFVEWGVRHFGITPGERLSGHSPLHFDLSTFDLFGALAAGAELHLVPSRLSLSPHDLAEWIRASRLTQWFSVPSLLAYMARFDAIRAGDFPELRRLLWCGEVFPPAALQHWRERLPHVRFTNLYGPTEATIASTFYDVPDLPPSPIEPVPIGRPCPGEEILVLDEDLRPVAPGEQGELWIAGVGLSPGYWRDPERTAEVFRADPANPERRLYRTGDLGFRTPNGLLHFAGRADSQIKSRGYRIELGEIECALGSIRAIGEVIVTAVRSEGFEGNSICCAYVPAGGPDAVDAGPAAIRRQLAELVPEYMLPSRWAVLSRLPRNANGKLDRKATRELFEAENRNRRELSALG